MIGFFEVRREPGAMSGSVFATKIKSAEDGWEQFFRVEKIDLPGATSSTGAPSSGSVQLPGSGAGCADKPEVRLLGYAWNAQMGLLLANLGNRMPGTTGEETVRSVFGRVPDGMTFHPSRRRYPTIAVRLPRAFRFPGHRVRVRRVPGGILLEPMIAEPRQWFAELDRLAAGAFMREGARGRRQPRTPKRSLFK